LGLTDVQVLQNVFQDIRKTLPISGSSNYTLNSIVSLTAIVKGPAIFLTCLGGVVLLLALLGCITTSKRHFIKHIYAILTLLVILLELAAIVYSAVPAAYQNFENTIKYNMDVSLQQSFQPMSFTDNNIVMPSSESADSWIAIQIEYSCCGVDSYTDYQNYPYSDWKWNNIVSVNGVNISAKVPPSCCQRIDQNSNPINIASFDNMTGCLQQAPSYANTAGCANYVLYSLTRAAKVSVISCAVLVALQMVAFVLTMHLTDPKGKEQLGS
jgi:hypothetical protein